MSTSSTTNIPRWIAPVLKLVGLAIFVLAFFEPAVARENQNYAGWKCASVAVSFEQNIVAKPGAHHEPFEYLAGLSGLINPLILIAILLSPFRLLLTVRRVIAVLIVACMIATWVLFAQQQISPLMGHYLWIAGALLVIAPELLPASTRKATGA